MRNLVPLTLLGLVCLFGTRQAQAQLADQILPPMPPVIEWPSDQTAKLLDTYYAVIFSEAEFRPSITRPTQGGTPPDLAAQERCEEVPVDVTAVSSNERRFVCAAARDALQLIGRCNISPRRPLHVQIMHEVRHPFSGPIFGLFDTKQERVLVTQFANIPSLIRDTPYSELPQREFYKCLIVHEVVHGVMHQNLKRPATSHAAYEYPAYALQIESLPSSVRDQFLHSFDQKAIRSDALFSDAVLHFDPFFFAARAYQHFKASADGCSHLHALLVGEVPFIPTLPLRW